MSEAAEYPVKDIMVTGNVSLQRPLLGGKSIIDTTINKFLLCTSKWNGRDTVCTHSRSYAQVLLEAKVHQTSFIKLQNVTLIGCMI
jgi:hypothetical protein